MRKESKKLLKNVGMLTIGSFSSKLLGFFLLPLYTAVLSTTDYGVYDLIATTTSLLFPFTTVAISEAIMRFSLDKNSDKKTIYTSGLLVIALGYLVLLFAMPLMKRTSLAPYLGYFYIYYGLYCLHTITSYFVKGLENVAVFSASGIISTTVVIGSNLILLLVFKMGLQGYLISMMLSHAVAFLYLFIFAKCYRYIKSPAEINTLLLKRMLKYSVVIIPNSLSWWIANSSDKYMLNYYCSLSDVGIYSVAHKIPTIINTLMGVFISAWHLSAVDDFGSERSKSFFSQTYNKFFLLIVIAASFLIVTSKLMGNFFYAKEFFVAYLYAPVLVLASCFDALASFMGSVYIAAKKSSMLAISTLTGAGVNIVLNFLLIPLMGIMGAALATVFSYVVIFAIRLINTRKIIKFDIHYCRDICLLILVIVQMILVVIDTNVSIAISVAIFIVCAVFVVDTFKDVIFRLVSQAIRVVKNRRI